MFRLLRNVLLVAAFGAMCLIAVGLMIGTMDVSSSEAQIAADHILLTQSPEFEPEQSVVVAEVEEEEVEAEPQPDPEVEALKKRVSTLETQVVGLQIDQPRRLTSLVQKAMARRQEKQQQVIPAPCPPAATAKPAECATCNIPAQPARPVPDRTVYSTPVAQPTRSQYISRDNGYSGRTYTTYSRGGRRVTYYGRR
jgi:hypothetical protein